MAPQMSREEFAQRLHTQLISRYRDVSVSVDEARFALRIEAQGIDTALPLTPLYNACERKPAEVASLIASFVADVETRLTPTDGVSFALSRVLWCVRSERYLGDLSRSAELLQRPLGGDLVAFVAEALPGSLMRGIPQSTWREAGHDDDAVRHAADTATTARFENVVERVAAADRIPADGWRLASDVLFQGSVLVDPAVLRAFSERAGGDVLFCNPDRSVVLALPAALPSARHFTMRAVREWREAMNPVSRDLYISDGSSLRALPRRRGNLMPWLAE